MTFGGPQETGAKTCKTFIGDKKKDRRSRRRQEEPSDDDGALTWKGGVGRMWEKEPQTEGQL